MSKLSNAAVNGNKSLPNTDEWIQVEDLGVRMSQVRNALKVGSWALFDQDDRIGGCAEEMNDFIYIVNHFLTDMEDTCQEISSSLLKKKKAEEGVA